MKGSLKNYLSLNKICLMQTKQILFWCFFGIFSLYRAQNFQNLVPNGSFETYTQCPTGPSQIYQAFPWTGPLINSSDYNNSCSPIMNVPHYAGISNAYPYFLNAKDGQAYSGIWLYQPNNFREYAQVELLDTLKNGVCYYVEFYATNTQWTPVATNNIAANLSSISYPVNMPVGNSLITIPSHITNYGNPILKDTVKWEKVSGIYEAQGIEKYIIIGNFHSNAQTDTIRIYKIGTGPILSVIQAYIYIDAVSVYSINPNGILPWTNRDTIINKGDTVFIGNKMGGLNFHPKWFNQNGTYIATNSGIAVSPTITTKYFVQYTLCGVQRTDTVKVTIPKDEDVALQKIQLLNQGVKLFPNPAKDILQLQFTVDVENEFKTIRIYNNLGQLLREEDLIFKNKTASIKTDDLRNGVYVLKLHSKSLQTVSKRFVINR
jgi:Secretion system C-terminal sorting domain